MARASEDELIARHLAPLAGLGGLGLKDDAALLVPRPGHDLVLTVDAIVEGVHFLPGDPPETLAAKALGVNLSDLGAKGAAPIGFLMVLALPDDWTEDWLAAFCAGLGDVSRATSCPLLGGDTVRAAGPLSISVTALGEVPSGTMVRRTTARPGDLVCVTGTIGDAALGLDLLTQSQIPSPLAGEGGPAKPSRMRGDALSVEVDPSSNLASRGHLLPQGKKGDRHRAYLIDRYRRPQPRLAIAAALRTHASAAMDVSDGLVGDLAKMLRASRVTGTLDLDRIPLSQAAKAVIASAAKQPSPSAHATPGLLRSARNDGILDRIVGGGDDYEILFTLPPDRLDAMRDAANACGLAIAVIGEVGEGAGPLAITRGRSAYMLGRASFQHFGIAHDP